MCAHVCSKVAHEFSSVPVSQHVVVNGKETSTVPLNVLYVVCVCVCSRGVCVCSCVSVHACKFIRASPFV